MASSPVPICTKIAKIALSAKPIDGSVSTSSAKDAGTRFSTSLKSSAGKC
jgi:hypothetical protein